MLIHGCALYQVIPDMSEEIDCMCLQLFSSRIDNDMLAVRLANNLASMTRSRMRRPEPMVRHIRHAVQRSRSTVILLMCKTTFLTLTFISKDLKITLVNVSYILMLLN